MSKRVISKFTLALAITLTFSACSKDKGGDGGGTTPSTPVNCSLNSYGQYVDQYGNLCNQVGNTCAGYYYNPSTGQWHDSSGRVVAPGACTNNYVDFQNFLPYNYMQDGRLVNGCEGWSHWYPGNYYVPVRTQFGFYVCANQTWANHIFGGMNWNNYYVSTCRPYVDCHANCRYKSSGGGVSILGGLFWIGGGGTVVVCDYDY